MKRSDFIKLCLRETETKAFWFLRVNNSLHQLFEQDLQKAYKQVPQK